MESEAADRQQTDDQRHRTDPRHDRPGNRRRGPLPRAARRRIIRAVLGIE